MKGPGLRPTAFRSAWRLLAIGRTLARHDVLAPLIDLGLLPTIMAWPARFLSATVKPLADPDPRLGKRLSAAFQELGPTFIKMGQTLATRSDLVGEAVANDLSSLQDRLPPFATEEVDATVLAELGDTIEALYESFDRAPIAAASIAQVHFAVTRANGDEPGRPVAVKVLRPGIERRLAQDLELFRTLAEQAERFVPWVRRLKPREVVRTLAEGVAMELDLRLEASAAAELADNFEGDPGFRVPRVDWARTGKRVLTIGRVDGLRFDDAEAILASGLDIRAVLTNAAEAFFNQVFRDGFFHADMHPGNLFVASDGAIVAIDFGIMGRLDQATRFYLADMLLGFLEGDYARVARVHFDAGYVPANQSIELFTQACRAIGEPVFGRKLAEISVARLLGQLFEVTERFAMETQPQLLLLQKSMLVAEGVGRRLDPSINIWELAQPMIESWMIANRGPQARARHAARQVGEALERLPKLLTSLADASERVAGGGVRLHPDTIAALAAELEGRRRGQWLVWLAIGVTALVALTR